MSDKIIKLGNTAGTPAGNPFAAGKVVKREAYDAISEGQQIIEAAHAQARKIRDDAEQMRESIFEAAQDAGYQRGLQQWNEAVEAAGAACDRYLASIEPEVVRLAVRIAQKIIGDELQTRPDTIVSIARECIHGLRRERSLTLRVAASDVDIIRGRLGELREAAGPDRSIDVVADPGVAPGGCIVESEYGTVDARLETQIRCMEEILLRVARK